MMWPTLLTDVVFPIILIIDDSCFSLQKTNVTIFSINVWGEYKFISPPTSCLTDGPLQLHALKPLINKTASAVSWSLLSSWRTSILRLINTPEVCPGFLLCTTLAGHWDVLKGRWEINLKVYFTVSILCVSWGNTISYLLLITLRRHF